MALYNELNGLSAGEQLEAMQTGQLPEGEEKKIGSQFSAATKRKKQKLGPAAEQLYQAVMAEGQRPSSRDLTEEALEAGYGDSRYDYRNPFVSGEDIEDVRAKEQGTVWKIANGAARGVVTALTTAANTVAGTAAGIVEGGLELGREVSNNEDERGFGEMMRNSFVAGVNNDVSSFLTAVRNLGSEWFPEYRTVAEQNDPWWKHFGSPNQIGEFLDNFGFTIGAMGAGAAISKTLGRVMSRNLAGDLMRGVSTAAVGDNAASASLKNALARLSAGTATTVDTELIIKNIQGAARELNKMQTKLQIAGGVLSAFGEGSFEGINARDEFLTDYLGRLDNDYQFYLANIEDVIKQNPDYVDIVDIYDAFGNKVDEQTRLNSTGRDALFKARHEASNQYQRLRRIASAEADDLAATVFALNIPLLTASNTFQFGKMLSGGWKSARKNAIKTFGTIGWENGAPQAAVNAMGNTGLRAFGRAVSVGMSEFGEEMSQGAISSGAKNVANLRMTAFNDRAYDANVLSSYAGWVDGMLGGARDYLGDPENLNEGVMGLITGLLGVPSIGRISSNKRGLSWEGGIPGAIMEAKESVQKSNEYANKLNQTINTKDFQERWKGWVRHNSLDREMSAAVAADDPYAWHGANNEQLINDVLLFEKTGRLNDLEEIVDKYSEITAADADDIRKNLYTPDEATNLQIKSMNPSELVGKVKEQANNVKEAIKLYRDTYDALYTLMPRGVSDEQLDEVLFTSMQLRDYEKRFFRMLGETLDALAPQIEKDIRSEKEDISKSEMQDQLSNALAAYTRMYAANPVPGKNDPTSIIASVAFKQLEEAVNGNEELEKKVKDMNRLAQDRRDFYRKLRGLQTMAPDEFAKEAITPEKATETVKVQKAKQETDGLNTLDEVKQAYFSKDANGKADILSSFEAVEDSNENVKKFMDIKRRYDDFQNYLNEHPATSVEDPTVTPPMIQSMLNDAYHRSQSVDDLTNLPDNVFRSRSAFNKDFQSPFGPMSPTAYDSVKKILREAMRNFMGIETATATRNTINPEPTEPVPANPTSTPIGYDAAQPGSLEPVPQASGEPEGESTVAQKTPQPAVQEYITPTDATDEQLAYDAADVALEDEGVSEETVSQNEKDGKDARLRTSVPEIDSGEAKLAREALAPGGDKDAYKEADLSDFVLKHPEYADIWNALKQRGAFDYVSTELSAEDEIEFIVDPTFPTYNGKYQILVAVKNGDGHQIITVLSNQESKYYGLSELRQAINSEYQSFRETHPNDIFIFSKKSKVFKKQPGLIDYGSREDEKGIVDIPAYDKTAPIVFIDKQGKAVTVRGYDSDAASKVSSKFVDADRNMGKEDGIDRRGNLYYLAQSGAGRYIPIRLNVEHFKKENKDADNLVFNNIRKSLGAITNIVRESNSTNLDEQNQKLRAELTNLASNLDIHKFYFEIGDYENVGTALRIKEGETSVLRRPDQITEEWLTDYIADQNLSVQLKMDKNGKLRNLSQLIESGIITSNARMLRAKGVDFYAYPWRNETKDFGPVTPEQAELQQEVNNEQNERGVSEISDVEEPFDDRDDFGLFDDDFDSLEPSKIDEEIAGLQASLGADETNEATLSKNDYSSLPKDIQKNLIAKGWSEEEWNNAEPGVKERVLKCLGA